MQERRKAARLPRQEKTFVDRETGKKEVSLMDISYGGMRVQLDEELKIGDTLSLKINILPRSGAFYVRGQVLWVKPISAKNFETGVKFAKISTIPL
jgi:Tfp pilus assembly protein PilZ